MRGILAFRRAPVVFALAVACSGPFTLAGCGSDSASADQGPSTGSEAAVRKRASTPYTGTPAAIPGTVEAETFDNGGQSIAYSDVDAGNAGGAYRSTDVDLRACDDTGGGYEVFDFATGEWLKYTVNVATSGTYLFSARVASAFSGTALHAAVDGADVTGSLTVPNTGSWSTFANVTKAGIALTSGVHVITIYADAQWFDFNSFSLAFQSAASGGTLTGSRAAGSWGNKNLASEGTLDWAHWGYQGTSGFNHKSGSTQQIGNFTELGTAPLVPLDCCADTFTWSGGTPTASASGVIGGVYVDTPNPSGDGFQFTVAADTTVKTLKVYVGTFCAQAKMQATLSDGSAAAYVDTSFDMTGANYGTSVYTVSFNAASSGQTLTVKYTVGTNHCTSGDVGEVWLLAATLAGSGGGGSCTPTTCAIQGASCDTIADGCGGTLTCGSCTAPQTCGGGGTANVCGGSASTGQIHPGAEGNYGLLPPVPQGTATHVVTSVAALQSLVSSGQLVPGDIVELPDGNYSGNVTLPDALSGTAARPIVIRSHSRHGAIISGCGGVDTPCWNINSHYVIVTGFQMQNTSTSVFRVEGSYNRVSDNRILNSGDGQGGSVQEYAIINSVIAGEHYNLIDSNAIEQPHNVALSLAEGSLGNVFSHNTIIGPWTMDGGETMAIKVGCCKATPKPPIPTVFQFNTIQGWESAYPYLGSSKLPFVRFLYNRIEGHSNQFLMTRNSDDDMLVGNYFDDGNIVLMGARHLVRDNFVRTRTEGYYGAGPLVVYNTQGEVDAYGNYDPQFYRAFTDGQVIGNKLINLAPNGFGVVTPIEPACDNSGITYQDNVLVADSGTYFADCAQNANNTYVNNVQKTSANAGFDVNDLNPFVPFDATLTRGLTSSPP